MVITLGPDLDEALNEAARRRGVGPEALAILTLRERFIPSQSIAPRDDWERRLLEAASDCGISLPDAAVSSEGLYE